MGSNFDAADRATMGAAVICDSVRLWPIADLTENRARWLCGRFGRDRCRADQRQVVFRRQCQRAPHLTPRVATATAVRASKVRVSTPMNAR
jgi:hypothetical protein